MSTVCDSVAICTSASSTAHLRVYGSSLLATALLRLMIFLTAFRARFFVSVGRKMQKLQVLWTFKQRPGDSVEQFHTALLKLFDELSLMGEVHSLHQKMTTFVSGLNEHLRRHIATALLTRPDLTYDEVIALAVQHESIGKPQPADTPAMRRIDEQPQGNRQQTNRRSGGDAPQAPSEIGACPYCHEQGHTWDDCPKIKARKHAGTWRENNPPRRRTRQ